MTFLNLLLFCFVTIAGAQYTDKQAFNAILPVDTSVYSIQIPHRADNTAYSYILSFGTSTGKNMQVQFSNYYYNCSSDAVLFIDGTRTDLYNDPCSQASLVAARALFCGSTTVTYVALGKSALVQICTTKSMNRTPALLTVSGTTAAPSIPSNPYYAATTPAAGATTPAATTLAPGTCGLAYVANPYINGGVINEAGFQGIVGGKSASPGMYPYQAIVLDYAGQSFCGGSIISKDWVLTAAHCFENGTAPSSMKVHLGSFDISYGYGGRQCSVVNVIRHNNYQNNENDIALLQINCGAGFAFSNTIQPVCLAPSTGDLKSRTGTQVIISGWGTTAYNVDAQPSTLQHVVVAVSDHATCETKYAGGQARPGWLCAMANGRDSCQGDSGGPLVYYENNRYVQYGVVSFGYGCASPGFPGVYTDVPYYRTWINQKTGL